MKQNRRGFLKAGSLLLGGAFSPLPSIAKPVSTALPWQGMQPNAADPTDEYFWKTVREQFGLPKTYAYLNNGTMGISPFPVINAVTEGMKEADFYGRYGGWEKTQETLAGFVGAHRDEIALTHNVTDGINIVCWGLPLKKGDEVILTTHEHVGNAFPWLTRQRLDGIVIKAFTPASTAAETLARVKELYTSKTKAIAIPQIPCTQGQVLPAKEICTWAKSKGLFAFIDGAHGPGQLMLDLHDMGCDAYASCCHKWMLGPKGTGFLYVKKEFQNTLKAMFVGGGSDNAKWNMATTPISTGDYADNAHRYYGGTQSSALYLGVDAAIDFINSIGMQTIHNRIKYLGKTMQDGLLSLGDKVELITPTEEISRCAVNGFRVKGVAPGDLYSKCSDEQMRIRVVHENGLNSARVSTHIYNSLNEIERFIDLVKKV